MNRQHALNRLQLENEAPVDENIDSILSEGLAFVDDGHQVFVDEADVAALQFDGQRLRICDLEQPRADFLWTAMQAPIV